LTNPLILPLPCRPGDWVQDKSNARIAQVRSVYRDSSDGEVLVDLWLYDHDGNKLGRVSPSEGGPRTYEPACPYKYWGRVKKPTFPVHRKLETLPDGAFLPRTAAPPKLVHQLKNIPESDPNYALAHRLAADELSESLRIKGLDGGAKVEIEARIKRLRATADMFEGKFNQ
jgi:hypothetical protein